MVNEITYRVKIVFVDGEILIIDDAADFHFFAEKKAYAVDKNGYRIFFNQDQVKYIGRQVDINC